MNTCIVRRSLAAASVLLLLVPTAGCSAIPGSGGQVSGSGNVVTKQYDYNGFTGLRVDHTFAATVTRGDAFGVTVTADDNLVQHLRVEVKGDTLHIGLDPGMSYRNATLTADVTLPSLQALEVTGASTADVREFASQDALELMLSGGSKISLTGVRAGQVTMDVSGAGQLSGELQAQEIRGQASGAGQVTLEGSASRAQLEASGAGKLDLGALTLQDTDLQLSGGASGAVRVTGTLNVQASGGAHLDYYGSPTIGTMDVSGGAQVNDAGD